VIELVDSHAHIQEPEFADDREAVIERAQAAGVSTIVIPGEDVASSEAAIALAEHHQGVFATAGFHPHRATGFEGGHDSIGRLLEHPRCVALGEIGLDYYRMLSPIGDQVSCFVSMLYLASAYRKPVVVHCRDAWDSLADVLPSWADEVRGDYERDHAGHPLGVLHYFSADLETAQRYIDLGFLISIHTSVTHPKSSALREVAVALPIESLVVETDSPYGAPQSVRGKRNEPAYVLEAVKQIAALKGLPVEDVVAATTANARRLFRIPALTGAAV
jgi:TatD DNase family protein